jgi:predicted AAA+ superfamily ATPase
MVILAGPRQVGKTTLMRQALHGRGDCAMLCADTEGASTGEASLDGSTMEAPGAPRDGPWLVRAWQEARGRARQAPGGFVLAIDEVQKVPRWSEIVKGLWDQDRAEGLDLRVVLLGSSPLLVQHGLTESLAGRYELIRLAHWSYPEMHEAFGLTLDEYLYFGGYPGSAPLIRDEDRWRAYVRASLIDPSIRKDVLLMTRVDKPALLRQVFAHGCEQSGQILSFNKMLGQLQDAGNTVTLAHYLELLATAGLVVGLRKYAGQRVRRRAASPKLNVLNTALMSVASGYSFAEARADRGFWGRLVESAVGAHLVNTGLPECEVYYWRESPHEVDFLIERGPRRTGIEVKSGRVPGVVPGLDAFCEAFGGCNRLVIGEGGISLAELFSYPAEHWLG